MSVSPSVAVPAPEAVPALGASVAPRILGWLARHRGSGAIWLDGGDAGRGWFGARPVDVVQSDDLDGLDQIEARWRARPDRVFMGWLTYEAGSSVVAGVLPRRRGLPGLSVAEYAAALELGPSTVRRHGDFDGAHALWHEVLATPPMRSPPWPFEDLRASLPAHRYRERVEAALEHLRAGDAYQVNLSQPFVAPWRGETDRDTGALGAYASLRQRSPAPMGGVAETPAGLLVSNSPETLLEVRRDHDRGVDVAASWPIKGTRPRSADPAEDARLRDELRRSTKDASEHVMIVDLVRNDLGRMARPGSVVASPIPELVTLPTVHHLVTQVRADLQPGWSLRELVSSMFPGGSITGAPKRRSMEIIDALEGEPRGIYCGSLLVLHPGGLRMSIAIRTGMVDADGLTVRGGGGIVIDSDPESERLETVAKVKAFGDP